MKLIKMLLAFFILLGVHGEGLAQETIRLTNGEFPPLCSEELSHYGIGSRVITEAFALEGVRVEYGFFEWKRSYDQAKAGRWDGSILWGRTSEREKHFYFTDPILMDTLVFFHLKSYPFDWSTMEDLKGVPIGATASYDYDEPFRKAERDGVIHVQRALKDELNLRKLLKGKIKVFPCNLYVGLFMIQKHFTPEQAKRFTHHPKPIHQRPFHLILSKRVERNKRMTILFNKGLKRLKEANKLEEYATESSVGDYIIK